MATLYRRAILFHRALFENRYVSQFIFINKVRLNFYLLLWICMKIIGKDIENHLNAISEASLLKRDNNDYLISYRLVSGKEVAFDPRTTRKASIFIGMLPSNLNEISGIGEVITYPPKKPSTALKRVSPQLDNLPVKYKVDITSLDGLSEIILSQI